MFGITRIVAFDDNADHLSALVKGLSQIGASCLGVEFNGNVGQIRNMPCPYVRVVFMDLNLVPGQFNASQSFGTVSALLKKIAPKGPYILVLWTIHNNQSEKLEQYLNARMNETVMPFQVAPLDKNEFLPEDREPDIDRLAERIRNLTCQHPVLNALSQWEENAFAAVAETVTSIAMASDNSQSSSEQLKSIPRLLKRIAVDVVGLENINLSPSRAVNQVLVPVLADHVTATGNSNDELWRSIFAQVEDYPVIGAQKRDLLNSALHIDFPSDNSVIGLEPGAVIRLPNKSLEAQLKHLSAAMTEDTAQTHFHCRNYNGDNPAWSLVQTQAPCDYAQNKIGFLPFHLGLEVSPADKKKNGQPPQSLWQSPPFTKGGDTRILLVSSLFPISLTKETNQYIKAEYRIREQLLNALLHHIHAHGSRPGAITIKEKGK